MKYPYNQQATLTKHHWDGVDGPTYVNSEVEQVEAGDGGWDKEHDEWRMLRELEAEEVDVRIAEYGMTKVQLNVDMDH